VAALKKKIGKDVERNKEISGELRNKVLKYTNQFLFIIQRNALLMWHKFDYKLQKSSFITFTRWPALKKKIGK